MKIAFVWFGISGRYGLWKDGLWKAMKHIEEKHEVKYFEPSDDISSFEPDVILFWEALCTSQSKDKDMWDKVVKLPFRKALLFAGGPIKHEWARPFDHIFVESKLNKDEFDALGISNSTAFGVNEEIMRPIDLEKKWIGVHHGTSASWKRQWLVGEALGKDALIIGRYQENDRRPFDDCKKFGATVLEEKTPEELVLFLNQALCCVQTSNYWGGGQRCTLEAMACNLPVIVMKDSPKNMEYVQESGFGLICEPEVPHIKNAIEEIKKWEKSNKGREYVMSKWTSRHYADSLLKWIENK